MHLLLDMNRFLSNFAFKNIKTHKNYFQIV